MRYSVALLIGVIVLTVGTVTSAQTIEFTFSAPLTKVDPLVENIFTVGDMATIRYSFDASTPVLEPPTETAHYRAIQSLQLAIQLSKGGVYTATASSGVITVSDNISAHGLTVDHYFAGATNHRPLFDLSAPAVNGMTITGVFLSLWDTTAAVFSSLALPLWALTLFRNPSDGSPRILPVTK